MVVPRPSDKKKVTDRLKETVRDANTSSFTVRLWDGNEFVTANEHSDVGADECIVSSKLAEFFGISGIGKMSKMSTAKLLVALKEGSDVKQFTFSRSWTRPRTVIQLSYG